jgi:competence ComEA-like helix-hairpin-helix protein
MKIDINVLKDFIKEWDTTINWTEKELENICSILESISLNNGGRIKYDTELEDEVEQEYIISTINTAFQKVMKQYAGSVKQNGSDYYYIPNNDIEPALDFLSPSKYVEKIDINRSSIKELQSIPDIGPVAAQNILEYRNKSGFFNDSSEVINVNGIGETRHDKIKYSIYAGTVTDKLTFIFPLLLEFKSNPTFSNYLKLIKSSHGCFVTNEKIEDEFHFKNTIISELQKINDYIDKTLYPKFGRYGRKKASDIAESFKQHKYVQSLEEKASTDIKGVCVIDDEEYLSFIKKLLSIAQIRIRIIMFFMKFEDEEKYPTDSIFAQLESAKNRNVDIKVILDKDAEGEVFGSRIINENAYNFFKQNDIEVTYDSEETLTHTKIVLVDDNHLVIGSHNWTAGSFYAYDDKSIYIESPEMVEEASNYFDKLWSEYKISE